MKTNKFCKGDWVVFPDYNDYPVQLEEDGKFGLLHNLPSGSRFVEYKKQDSELLLQYCVSDPRQKHGTSFNGWYLASYVKIANKSDLNKLKKILEIQYDLSKKELLNINRVLKAFN